MRLVVLTIALLLTGIIHAATLQTVTLDVQNMTCPVCPITVKHALEKTPGVSDARIDFDKKTAVVRFDSGQTGPAALIKATTNAGYPSTVRK